MGTTVTDIEKSELKAIEELARGRDKIKNEIAKVIVGQEEVIELLYKLFNPGELEKPMQLERAVKE